MIDHIEVVPLSEKTDQELQTARREALARQEPIEPTEEEKKNGWTKETLTKYLAEREAAQSLSVDVNSLHRQMARRKDVQNHRYRVHRWRD